ncbi:MAG: hypothetical protein IPJ25_09755 [Rhodocyclaceae bacterium]|nr:hypothetical protein [Rhodocyclaceae bacterium]
MRHIVERARRNERSLPLEIANVLDGNDVTHNAALLLGFPEHQVRIEGGGHASQNDVWALLQLRDGAASMSVEAKSGEPFDKLVADWLRVRSDGSNKPQRLDSLRRTLGIVEENVDGIRYQLLHRTASPLLEAKRFRASIAIMIVQSFGVRRMRTATRISKTSAK